MYGSQGKRLGSADDAGTRKSVSMRDLHAKMDDVDPDIRFMACSDFYEALVNDTVAMDTLGERRASEKILQLLMDTNGEVQNQAVRCAGALVLRVSESAVVGLATSVCGLLSDPAAAAATLPRGGGRNLTADEVAQWRDIGCMALKAVIKALAAAGSGSVAAAAAPQVAQALMPRAVPLLESDATPAELLLDLVEIAHELLVQMGSSLREVAAAAPEPSAAAAPDGPLASGALQRALVGLLGHPRSAVRRKAAAAMGPLVTVVLPETAQGLVDAVLARVATYERREADEDRVKSCIATLGTIARFSPHNLGAGKCVSLLNVLLRHAAADADELAQAGIAATEAVVVRYPAETATEWPRVVSMLQRAIAHDTSDRVMSDGDFDDGFSDEEPDDDEDDDDDESWKVRAAALRFASTLLQTRPDQLTALADQLGLLLVARFRREREEALQSQVGAALVALFEQAALARSGSAAGRSGATLVPLQDGSGADASQSLDAASASLDRLIPEPKKRRIDQVSAQPAPRKLPATAEPSESTNAAAAATGKLVAPLLEALWHRLPTDGGSKDVYEMLTWVLRGFPERADEVLGRLLPHLASLLGAETAQETALARRSPAKTDALEFVRELCVIARGSEQLAVHAGSLLDAVLGIAVRERFHATRARAFAAAASLVEIVPTNDAGKLAQPLCDACANAVTDVSTDVEVKNSALGALAAATTRFSTFLSAGWVRDVALPLLLDRVAHEVTRSAALQALRQVAEDPAAAGDLPGLAPKFVRELAALLRQATWHVRAEALQALCAVLGAGETVVSLGAEQLTQVYDEAERLLDDADLSLLPMTFSVLARAVQGGDEAGRVLCGRLLQRLCALVATQSHLLTSRASLGVFLSLWKALVQAHGGCMADAAFEALLRVAESLPGQPAAPTAAVAKALATVALYGRPDRGDAVRRVLARLEGSSPACATILVLAVGEMGASVAAALSGDTALCGDLRTALQLLRESTEEVQQGVALATGRLAAGCPAQFLGDVVRQLEQAGSGGPPSLQHALLAVREMLTRVLAAGDEGAWAAGEQPLEQALWTALLGVVGSGSGSGSTALAAECLGKQCAARPTLFLPQLGRLLVDAAGDVRAVGVTAVRLAMTDASAASGSRTEALLRPLVMQALRLVRDPDERVRRVALSALNVAAHTRPQTVRGALGELMPLLYEASAVRADLVHEVTIGPFKHRVDDGLEVRKAAFECLYALLDVALHELDIFTLLDRVVDGLRDPSADVKSLSNLAVQRLARAAPLALASKLPAVVDALRVTFDAAAKRAGDRGPKPDRDRLDDAVKAQVRTLVIVRRALVRDERAARDGPLPAGPGSAEAAVPHGAVQVFEAYYSSVTSPGGFLLPVFEAVLQEEGALA